MDITKLSRTHSYEQIADQIRQQIVSGKLKPGDRLPSTKELAERFAVGRSSMREALSALKAMGYIDIRQGEGCTVRQFDAEQLNFGFPKELMTREAILELLEARKALETSNAAIAAAKRTDADLRSFESILERMQRNLGNELIGEEMDLQFHLALAESTHNRVMVQLLKTISSEMERAIRETRRRHMYGDRPTSERLWREHHGIYEAVRDGEPAQARERMEQHLLHVERMVMVNANLRP